MIEEFVKKSLEEDIGRGDLFALMATNKDTKAEIISKDSGILAGAVYVEALCKLQNLKLTLHKKDGEHISRKEKIAEIEGDIKNVLSSERTILNLLQHASGIATNTAAFKALLKDSPIKLLDTRKTRPLLRSFEKYAVRVGGGINHRMGLDDCLMLKDTHLATIDDLKEFVKEARNKIPFTSKIEIECESLEGVREALECGVEIIMCDNMSIEDIKKSIDLRDSISPSTLIEVSGNITKESLEKLVHLKVDAISSGSLVHQATWLDISMKIY